MVIITGGVMAVAVAVVVAAVAITPGKGSGKNPEKSFSRRKKEVPLRFPMQKGVQVGVIGAPLDASPA